ncbi:hypothetical protein [Achromobacter phage Motura]|uniref:Uncharacterized protein n=1 Tax=Achromobacter phage Motura TaxID=2591403 RepID=A0A514CSQ6_9CAUD|nr:hypothetical protein H1O15_gp300 [Achromobacter phage Motura]QDH83506.1 hypothetical protein [Achromobacter phage Motura]
MTTPEDVLHFIEWLKSKGMQIGGMAPSLIAGVPQFRPLHKDDVPNVAHDYAAFVNHGDGGESDNSNNDQPVIH